MDEFWRGRLSPDACAASGAADARTHLAIATEALGGLEVQLIYYRGFGECRASRWVANSGELLRFMTGVFCLAGQTQLGKVLKRAIKETRQKKVSALVFVGDAMEEPIDDLCVVAGELGLLGVRAFMFQEGYDPMVETAYREIARLTHGAYGRFDAGAAHELGELLRAVAAYAAGGLEALQALSSRRAGGARKLLAQLR